jgi:TctA family transporter
MIQFYFLSIVLNALSGYVLSRDTGDVSIGDDADTGFRLSLQNETSRLILGVLTIVMGLLKILSSFQGDLPIIGDFIPAVAGFFAGFSLVFEYYRSRSTLEPEHTDKIEHLLIHNKKWIGYFALAAAALHFLFPSVLFL